MGTENQNLPAYITLKPGLSHGGAKKWSSGFLPAAYQGTAVGLGGMPIENLTEPIEHLKNHGLTPEQQRYELDMIQKMNRASAARWRHESDLDARIQSFELAFRMQTEAPEAFDISKESEATKKLYGLDEPETKDFGWQCLMARRLAERNVRFIQINHEYGPGNEVGWDAHSELVRLHTRTALQVDQPIAALLHDLKTRGLLDDTLVIWGGEFGRTPIAEAGDGRDHNPYGYTIWMAGAGVKKGYRLRRNGRVRLLRRRGPDAHPRSACDDAAHPGSEPREPDLPVRRAALPADRCRRRRREEDPRLGSCAPSHYSAEDLKTAVNIVLVVVNVNRNTNTSIASPHHDTLAGHSPYDLGGFIASKGDDTRSELRRRRCE